MIRKIIDWKKIFEDMDNPTTEDVAARVLEKLAGYPTSFSKVWQDKNESDVAQLAMAMMAYVNFLAKRVEYEKCNLCEMLIVEKFR